MCQYVLNALTCHTMTYLTKQLSFKYCWLMDRKWRLGGKKENYQIKALSNDFLLIEKILIFYEWHRLNYQVPFSFAMNNLKLLDILKGKSTYMFSAERLPLSAPPPAGSTHWSLVGSRKQKTFGGKRICWFTQTRSNSGSQFFVSFSLFTF